MSQDDCTFTGREQVPEVSNLERTQRIEAFEQTIFQNTFAPPATTGVTTDALY